MTNSKTTKRALFSSVIALILCFAMLLGTTFAWFTDTVSTGRNKIVAGNLDIELYHSNRSVSNEQVGSTTLLFDDVTLWEPGAVAYENFTLKNVGTLALKYVFNYLPVTAADYNTVVEANGATTDRSLLDVLYVKVTETAVSGARPALTKTDGIPLKDFLGSSVFGSGALDAGASKVVSVILYWPNDLGNDTDNLYNLNNGRTASDGTKALRIDLGIELHATQYTQESDSFDNQYDKDADGVNNYGVTNQVTASQTAASGVATTFTVQATPATDNAAQTQVAFPADVLDNGESYNLSVVTNDAVAANIQISGGNYVAGIDLTLTDSNGNEVSDFSANVPITTYIAKGLTDVQVVYTGTDGKSQPTLVSYDPATGELVFTTNHFSNYAVECNQTLYVPETDMGYTSMATAAKAGTVVLLKDVTFYSLSTVSGGDTVIDLNGKTLTITTTATKNISGGATLTVENGTLAFTGNTSTSANIGVQTGSSVTVRNAEVISSGSAFYPRGDAASVTIEDSTVTAGCYCVATNAATADNYGVVITLKDSTFTATNSDNDNCPVMINVPGTLNIDNCTITGQRQGVIVRAGDATISNSTITTLGTYSNKEQYYNSNWGSGNEVPAAALVIGNQKGSYNADANCTLTNTTVSADNGFAAIYIDANATYSANLTSKGVANSITRGQSDNITVNVEASVSSDEELKTALMCDADEINVLLNNDVTLDLSQIPNHEGGTDAVKLGTDATSAITIDGNGNKLTLNTNYWSVIGMVNSDATLTMKNMTVTSSQTSGTWNSYDVTFMCNVELDNVIFEKAVALNNAGKTSKLTNVTINETNDYYALWIVVGGDVTMDGCKINSAGRAIKISDQYVAQNDRSLTTLSVSNTSFTSVKKSAILVGSTAGATITWGAGNDITGVAADQTNAIWVDNGNQTETNEQYSNYAALVTVTGGTVIVEP